MSIFLITPLVAAIACFSAAHFLYLQDPHHKLNRISAAVFFSSALFFFAEVGQRGAATRDTAAYFLDLQAIGFPLMALYLHFVWAWTRNDFTRMNTPFLIAAYGSSLVLGAAHPLLHFFGEPAWHRTLHFWTIDTHGLTSIRYAGLVWVIAVGLACTWLSISFYFFHLENAEQRRQHRLVFVAIQIPLMMAVLFDAIPIALALDVPDLTGLFYAAGATVLVIGMQQQRLFTMSPAEASKQIISSMSEALVLTDAEGQIFIVNPPLCALVGKTEGELVGQKIESLFVDWPVELIIDQSLEVQHGRAGHIRRADGSSVPVLFSIAPIREESAGMFGVVCTLLDISEQKRVEEELRSARDTAEAASRAKSAFLATMSHEIRTPMNGVIGMADLLMTTSLTSEQAMYVRTIRTSGDALLAIINDVLDFSKIEAGRIELERRPVILREVVSQMVDLFAARAKEKGIELRFNEDPAVPIAIEADPTRLRQVLSNLLSNALKFTAEGEIELSLMSRPIPGDRFVLYWAVRDTGIGIPEANLGRLFRAFSQGDSSITRKFGGTGLGLAISKRLVELMGGKIWVETKDGQGSTFRFTLHAPLAIQLAVEPEPSPVRFSKKTGRVLVVEDDAGNRRVARLMLKKLGFQAELVKNGKEAVAAIEQGTHELVLMDVQMPEMDGLEATREIRARHPGVPIYIIAVTANATTHERQICLAAGMDAYLTKPLRPDELQRTLDEAIARLEAPAPA